MISKDLWLLPEVCKCPMRHVENRPNTIFLKKVCDSWQCSSLVQQSNENWWTPSPCSHSRSMTKAFKASGAESDAHSCHKRHPRLVAPRRWAGPSPAGLHPTILRYTGLQYRDTIFTHDTSPKRTAWIVLYSGFARFALPLHVSWHYFWWDSPHDNCTT